MRRYLPDEYYPAYYWPRSRREWIAVAAILLGYLALYVVSPL